MRRRVIVSAACAFVTALVSPHAAHAQDDVLDRTPEDCISVSRVRSTSVIDDQTIIFYMRNRDQVYRNDLPRQCSRLANEERFSYESRGGRLCEIDTITVLESFGGRFSRGVTCRLGEFVPITRIEAADIEAGPEGAKRENEDVGVEEVELPDENEDGDAGEE